MNFCDVQSFIQKFTRNSFKVVSEPSGAKVTYIVDPYDSNKDITCTTPCTIDLPWEPNRSSHNKDKLLIEKEGYEPKVVRFRYGLRTMLKHIPFIIFISLYFYYFVFHKKNTMLIIYPIIFFSTMVYSIGSDKLDVVLEKDDN